MNEINTCYALRYYSIYSKIEFDNMSDSFPKGSGLEVVSVNITIINRRCTHINTSLHDTIYYQKSIPHDK